MTGRITWDGIHFYEDGRRCAGELLDGGREVFFRASGAELTSDEKRAAFDAYEIEREIALDRAEG